MNGRNSEEATARSEHVPETFVLKVQDMTCGHCAGVITEALEAGLPGAKVQADSATRLVTIKGAQRPREIATLIRKAGYTPRCAPLG